MNISSSWLRSYLSGEISEPLVISTTGSGGVEKKVEIPAAALIASANAAHKYLEAKEGDSWSLLLPTNHIAGINVLTRSILLNSELKNISQKAEFTSIVPTQLYKALSGDQELLNHLKKCKAVLVGGARTPVDLLKKAEENSINVVLTYGATETCGGCVYNGEPLEGIKIRIQEGKVEINFPEMNGESWIPTNDLGEIVNGKLKILGRSDDIIISGGENLSLTKLEDFLEKEFPDQIFVAVSLPDEKWGDVIALASNKIISEGVFSKIENVMGRIYLPKAIRVIEEFPTMGIGKYDRKAITNIFLSDE